VRSLVVPGHVSPDTARGGKRRIDVMARGLVVRVCHGVMLRSLVVRVCDGVMLRSLVVRVCDEASLR
jgi:hypothetical protein